MSVASARVLVVGVGGLGAPLATALAAAGVATLGLCDDDEVDRSNLHRQLLFRDADVGRPKLDAACESLARAFPRLRLEPHATRLVPENALDLVARYDLVVEGSDNFATKFLAADACARVRRPVVHGAAIRWIGTALAVGARGRPCYRCLFEDLPDGGAQPTCDDAGVMGPVVGLTGALQADLALALLAGDADAAGTLVTVDGRAARPIRRRRLRARADCRLCGGPAASRAETSPTPGTG